MGRVARSFRSVVVLVACALLFGATAAGATYPNAMAATGDSITRAYNTGWFPFIDAPQNSWSTGTATTVNSHYLRILGANPLIKGKNYNDAKSGAKMIDLSAQMSTAAGQNVGYVTVLMGGNDVCTATVETMTDPATFGTQLQTALTTLTSQLPTAKVFVASVPNAYHLWELFYTNSRAVSTWNTYKVCQSLLANPTSFADADVARRNAVKQRNIDLNTQLANVCAAFAQCLFDGNAVFNTRFTATDVSARDYFHPSISGQAKLAAVTWAVSYWHP